MPDLARLRQHRRPGCHSGARARFRHLVRPWPLVADQQGLADMTGQLGPRGQFYHDALKRVVEDFPEADPAFDPAGFERTVRLQQEAIQADRLADDLRQRLARCEMANLVLGQALALVQRRGRGDATDDRIDQLIRSAMQELRLAEVGEPNPESMDTGPTVTMLAQARGHLEINQSIAGPARMGIQVATELIDLALQDVARLGLHLEQLKREQS